MVKYPKQERRKDDACKGIHRVHKPGGIKKKPGRPAAPQLLNEVLDKHRLAFSSRSTVKISEAQYQAMQAEHECLKDISLEVFRTRLARRRWETGYHDKLSILRFPDGQKTGELKPASNSLVLKFAEQPAIKAMVIYLRSRLEEIDTGDQEQQHDLVAV